MTTKEKSLHNLHQARTSHIRWVNSIKFLISGIDVSTESIALSVTDSLFGEWFYEEAMLFSLGISQMVLEEIEMLLLTLHDKYMKIYPIYYSKNKKTFFTGFLGGKPKVSEHEIELSQHYYEEIVILSDKLKHKLRVFESQLISFGDDKFDAVAEFINAKVSTSPDLKNPKPINNTNDAYFYGTRGR
jgi:hypothetical protein